AGPGCGARLPAPAGLQRLPAAGGVPEGGSARAGGPCGGLPAAHPAGHPVRLRHRQGCQAAGHHHHSGKKTVRKEEDRMDAERGRRSDG
ncbi:unnamed protein product, partial [Tetraodon nigroviridis]